MKITENDNGSILGQRLGLGALEKPRQIVIAEVVNRATPVAGGCWRRSSSAELRYQSITVAFYHVLPRKSERLKRVLHICLNVHDEPLNYAGTGVLLDKVLNVLHRNLSVVDKPECVAVVVTVGCCK